MKSLPGVRFGPFVRFPTCFGLKFVVKRWYYASVCIFISFYIFFNLWMETIHSIGGARISLFGMKALNGQPDILLGDGSMDVLNVDLLCGLLQADKAISCVVCFVFGCCMGWSTNWIALWLSHLMTVGPSWWCWKSGRIFRNQTASFAVSAVATYYVSVDEPRMTACGWPNGLVPRFYELRSCRWLPSYETSGVVGIREGLRGPFRRSIEADVVIWHWRWVPRRYKMMCRTTLTWVKSCRTMNLAI